MYCIIVQSCEAVLRVCMSVYVLQELVFAMVSFKNWLHARIRISVHVLPDAMVIKLAARRARGSRARDLEARRYDISVKRLHAQ